ncbi:MAG: histone deacetylase [Myxococcota bacterium]|nr:histone deacetylase [Myxococcota bacterium]
MSYSAGYVIPLPDGHRFPMRKFSALHEQLLAERLVTPAETSEPQEAEQRDLALVHTQTYLRHLAEGTLSGAAERRLGLPCSPSLWRRSRLAVQGSIDAARFALEDGVAANLAGGTHHAFPDYGEGFCVLNDVAIAIRALRRDGLLRRALVVDLDVHQGNGTAAVFRDDPDTTTFSVHGARNFPFHKEHSDLDVALPDGVGDEGYLAALAEHLPKLLTGSAPDLLCFLAGVDPVRGDRFGKLDLTREGLARRERFVLQSARDAGVPVAIFMSGGYAATPEATADLHAEVHRQARSVFGDRP